MHEHSSPRSNAGRHRRASSSNNAGILTLTLGLCLCAGQLLTSSPADAATATPVQAAATPLVKPTVSDVASAKTVTKGNAVYITSRVRDPRTGKYITKGTAQLQVWRSGRWNPMTNASIRSNGTALFGAKPTAYTAYRTLFGTQGNYQWAVSNVVRVGVTTPSSAGARILAEARRHDGALYKFGADGPTRFDCSGFTEYVYKKTIGKSLPHKANDQQHYGVAESHAAAKPGDLIIFRSGSYGYHAAIYAGGGYMYDSPHTGATVGKHKIYSSDYVVRRLAA